MTGQILMREVQASEAKTHLLSLLDEVERGGTLVITRHGKPIARIVPEPQGRQAEIDRAIEEIKALRTRAGKMTREEILSARDTGRKG
jgi:prevent-host-death family protein